MLGFFGPAGSGSGLKNLTGIGIGIPIFKPAGSGSGSGLKNLTGIGISGLTFKKKIQFDGIRD